MMSPKARLVLAASLFIAWIGWLVYLVVQSRNPVILSRPQFLVTDLYVTAHLTADDGKPSALAMIDEVLWAAPGRDKPAKGTQIEVARLSKCGPKQGWQGKGLYLLPLSPAIPPRIYRLVSIPPSPGYSAREPDDLRIYAATEDALRQVRGFITAKGD
jgi:hypothetical protein